MTNPARPLRVVFCWSNISGYMAACWRALAARQDIAFQVIAYGSSREAAFSQETMASVDWQPLDEVERADPEHVARLVANFNPDVIVVPGWMNKAYNNLVTRPEFSHVRFVMTMDTPWRGDFRQKLAPMLLNRHLSRMAKVVVTGERAFQYAVRLGIPEAKIVRGLYGVDHVGLGAVAEARKKQAWPRRFLFAGRYAEEKALDVLVEAYRRYRKQVTNPFELVTCGQGELAALLEGIPGVDDRGFRQPDQMKQELEEAGCFVLVSRFDPWPLALVEACAAGLPVIASSACGSAVENVRDRVNGCIVATGNTQALTAAMLEIHSAYRQLPNFGAASREFAGAYSAEIWVDRWASILKLSNIE